MSGFVERTANAAIAVAALVLVAVILKRELKPRASQAEQSPPSVIDFYSNWQSLDSASIRLDANDGSSKVYVFTDLECPYCAAFHQYIVPLLYRKYGRTVSVRVVQFPLKTHRFARQAAAALDCADEQGRASPFLDLVYSKQDSMGLIPWISFARASHVRDLDSYSRCLQTDRGDRIAAGMSLGHRFDVISTPTVIVNGWRFTGFPDSTAFLAAIDSVRRGASPVVSVPLQ